MAWSKLAKMRLAKLRELSWPERFALMQAAMTLFVVRSLLMLPFATAMRLLDRLSRPRTLSRRSLPPLDRIVWAVKSAGVLVPGGRQCLVRALAAKLMLGRNGYPAQLKFGAGKNPHGGFVAHAWLEHNGHILIGGFEPHSYAPMTIVNGQDAAARVTAR